MNSKYHKKVYELPLKNTQDQYHYNNPNASLISDRKIIRYILNEIENVVVFLNFGK